MADTKISDYAALTVPEDTDLIVTAQEDVSNKKLTWANLKNRVWLPPGYISGLVPSNDTDTDHDILVSAGYCIDSTNAKEMTLASGITKQIDAAWAVGSAAGGLDGTESSGGTPDASTIYHIYLIKRSDTGVVDVCFSENGPATGPSRDGTPIPAAYDYWRWIGWVKTDAPANIVPGNWIGNSNQLEFWFKARYSLATGLNQASYTAQATTGAIPAGIVSEALFGMTANDNSMMWISSDGINAKTIAGGVSAGSSIGTSAELYGSRATVFVPIIGNQVYYKVASGTWVLYLRGVRYWR